MVAPFSPVMTRFPTALAAVLLVVLAGCGGVSVSEAPDGGPAGPTAAGPLPSDTTEVSVTAVVDGDTIRIEYGDGTRDTVRLVGVDTPEVRGENDPSEFEGIPDSEAGADCLRTSGIDASNFAKDRLLGRTVDVAPDPNLDRRGFYDRLLAYVVVDDSLFNYRLVATGRARVYTESDFSREASFLDAETAAREDRRGLWRCADPASVTAATTPTPTPSPSGLALVDINADAAGNDNENLNDEYLVFANAGERALNVTGWTVTDAADHRYTFGRYTLAPGARVTLHTGSGTGTETDRYWGETGAVWNNGGDTVTVSDAEGRVVLQRSY